MPKDSSAGEQDSGEQNPALPSPRSLSVELYLGRILEDGANSAEDSPEQVCREKKFLIRRITVAGIKAMAFTTALVLAVPLLLPSYLRGPAGDYSSRSGGEGKNAVPASAVFDTKLRKVMWKELWMEGDRYCRYLSASSAAATAPGTTNAQDDALGLGGGQDFSAMLDGLKAREYGPRPEGKPLSCQYKILALSKDNSQGIAHFFGIFKDKGGNPYFFERKVAFEGHYKIREYVYGSGEKEIRILPFWVTSKRYPFGVGFERKSGNPQISPPDTRNWWQKHLGPKPFEEVNAPRKRFPQRKVPPPRMQQKRPMRLRRI
ncbi:hypothetical protein JW721_05590 [Candidatus Micrarchaeota archaeon]|nr:hypothetical protein [Candidatus Micrarchaeota archaeon]